MVNELAFAYAVQKRQPLFGHGGNFAIGTLIFELHGLGLEYFVHRNSACMAPTTTQGYCEFLCHKTEQILACPWCSRPLKPHVFCYYLPTYQVSGDLFFSAEYNKTSIHTILTAATLLELTRKGGPPAENCGSESLCYCFIVGLPDSNDNVHA